MSDPKKHRTRTGPTLTDEDIDAPAREVEETDYDTEALKTHAEVDPRWDQDLPIWSPSESIRSCAQP